MLRSLMLTGDAKASILVARNLNFHPDDDGIYGFVKPHELAALIVEASQLPAHKDAAKVSKDGFTMLTAKDIALFQKAAKPGMV